MCHLKCFQALRLYENNNFLRGCPVLLATIACHLSDFKLGEVIERFHWVDRVPST